MEPIRGVIPASRQLPRPHGEPLTRALHPHLPRSDGGPARSRGGTHDGRGRGVRAAQRADSPRRQPRLPDRPGRDRHGRDPSPPDPRAREVGSPGQPGARQDPERDGPIERAAGDAGALVNAIAARCGRGRAWGSSQRAPSRSAARCAPEASGAPRPGGTRGEDRLRRRHRHPRPGRSESAPTSTFAPSSRPPAARPIRDDRRSVRVLRRRDPRHRLCPSTRGGIPLRPWRPTRRRPLLASAWPASAARGLGGRCCSRVQRHGARPVSLDSGM